MRAFRPNAQLLRDTMDAVLAHPDEWDQHNWQHTYRADEASCKTSYCFAGWACVTAGVPMKDLSEPYYDEYDHVFTSYTADHFAISQTARNLLNIDERSASRLFHGNNSLEDLKHFVDVLCTEGNLWHV